MRTDIVKLLDQYCLSRNMKDTASQLEIADKLVDTYIPELMSRPSLTSEEDTLG